MQAAGGLQRRGVTAAYIRELPSSEGDVTCGLLRPCVQLVLTPLSHPLPLQRTDFPRFEGTHSVTIARPPTGETSSLARDGRGGRMLGARTKQHVACSDRDCVSIGELYFLRAVIEKLFRFQSTVKQGKVICAKSKEKDSRMISHYRLVETIATAFLTPLFLSVHNES